MLQETIQSSVVFPNFKHVYLETMFLKFVGRIEKNLLNRLTWNFNWLILDQATGNLLWMIDDIIYFRKRTAPSEERLVIG